MSDVHTTEPPAAHAESQAQDLLGHGRHRGSVSAEDAEATPRGRHRKPAEQHEPAESAA
ncbi:hypothetical protein [Streptomyces poonensis]|uniref:Uncharacterized protein n=1 Tax=Streptomyces poonensis TaxID=68255 RepID=A0A918PIG7_9ACTN|nr:hypothetical protein [Streptomyces poonensis]GGZ11066.1 hypothetical protein GCM10010365_33160 [Streptomyces poonensis]GLJ91626.1 hypothetical protein GCM10017589_42330 [Streptomyces poonensis]